MSMLDYRDQGSAATSMKPVAALVFTLEALHRASAVTAEVDRPWQTYLDTITHPNGEFGPAHVAEVKRLWESLRQDLGYRLPLPLTQPTNDGSIQLAWDAGRFYVEIDVRPSGELEWFFRDRVSNELAGTEDDAISELSPELLHKLSLVLPA